MSPLDRSHHQDGFTLIEVLVAMTISLVVTLATLQGLDAFVTSTGQQTRATDANAQVRSAVDRLVDDLRGAAVIRSAAATDLVYSVSEPSGMRTERLCVGGAAILYRSSSMISTTPGTACGTVGTGWIQSPVATLPATATTGFTYDGASASATPALVRSVGLTIGLNTTTNGRTSSSTLRASATLRRSAGTLPIGPGDLDASCTSNGTLLSLSVGAIGGLSTLGVSYATTGGVSLGSGTGSSPVQIPAGITAVIATITDAAGVTDSIRKTVECS
ncbi:MAG: hypothetical protein JWN65_2999 [Solirubrobacterales bacterium]|nr:hypothetical protein [Solirubrobacterales bacterium]